MEKQTVTLQAGSLLLPQELQRALGLEEGARLTASVRDGGLFLAREAEATSRDAALEAIQKLHGILRDGPTLEDELKYVRKQWEERLERLSA